MKQAQNARKQRSRTAPRKGGGRNNNGSGGGGNNRSDNRSRGNPKQLLEKYKTQARDALQAGEPVNAEYFFQFADHYQRVVNEMQANSNSRDQNNREQNTQQSEDGQQRNNGRGRNRHDRDQGRTQKRDQGQQSGSQTDQPEAGAETSDPLENVDAPMVDPSMVEQPTEVHPELDLGAATEAGADEAPKRRRPVRRRTAASNGDTTSAASPEAVGEEAPKPKVRRARKTKAEVGGDGEAAA
ncbi:MAG: DUF4167 domain-containing protein [Kordiimonadaceae bacterium]|nr:DUF4167 domain-containing protein [Kordiimonadaceae bacterium]